MQIYSVNGAEIPEKTSKPVTIVRTDEEAKERRDALAAKGLTEGVDYYLVKGTEPPKIQYNADFEPIALNPSRNRFPKGVNKAQMLRLVAGYSTNWSPGQKEVVLKRVDEVAFNKNLDKLKDFVQRGQRFPMEASIGSPAEPGAVWLNTIRQAKRGTKGSMSEERAQAVEAAISAVAPHLVVTLWGESGAK